MVSRSVRRREQLVPEEEGEQEIDRPVETKAARGSPRGPP